MLSCEGQSIAGHEVHLAFGPIFGPEGSMVGRVEAFNAASTNKITTHEVPSLVREIAIGKDRRCVREVRELIERIKPDIVHTHSSKAGELGREAAYSFWRERGRPAVVHTIHGPPFMPIEGSVFTRLKTRAINYGYTLAERRAAERCHAIVSVADAMTKQFLARRIGTPGLYSTVRSGIDTTPYLRAAPGEDRTSVRAALGITPDLFVVGTVARLAQHKGHDDLLSALAQMLRASDGMSLLWVGDGWWRERLVARAKSLGLRVRSIEDKSSMTAQPAHIVLTGLVPADRIPSLMRAMDVLSHPSTREGLPRTVPQALLAGVCPVAYDVDGTGEVCIDMRTGRLVRPGDVSALRDAILWCKDHPRERAALAASGRTLCERDFSVAAMLAGLEAVYARATERARTRR